MAEDFRDRLPAPELRRWLPVSNAPPAAAVPSRVALVLRWSFGLLTLAVVAAVVVKNRTGIAEWALQSLSDVARQLASNRQAKIELLGWASLLFLLGATWSWRQWFVPRWLRLACRGVTTFCLVVWSVEFPLLAVFMPETRGVSIGFGLPISIYAAWRLTRYLRVRASLRKAIPVAISGSEYSVGGLASATGSATVRVLFPALGSVFLWRGLRQFRGKPIECTAEKISVERPYQDFANALQPDLSPLFTRLRKILGLRCGVFDLVGETPEAHAWPLEAAGFLNAGSKARSVRSVPLRFRRSVPVAAITRTRSALTPSAAAQTTDPAELDLRRSRVEVCPNGVLGGNLQRVWERRFPNRAIHPGPTRILHLVGTSQEGSAGLRFRLLAQQSSGQPFRPLLDGAIRAEEIVDTCPELQLCILQGAPLRSLATRNDLDRRAAAMTRVLAARLFAQNVPLVVVVPPLEQSRAAKVTEMIVGYAAREGPHDGRAFLSLLDDIRHFISGSYPPVLDLHAGDLVNPQKLAARLCDPKESGAPLAAEFTASGRRDLARWQDLPAEALVGLLLNELNPIVRKVDLTGLLPLGRRTWLRFASGLLSMSAATREARNRSALAFLFKGCIRNGTQSARADAWENALDVCGFCAGDAPADATVSLLRTRAETNTGANS